MNIQNLSPRATSPSDVCPLFTNKSGVSTGNITECVRVGEDMEDTQARGQQVMCVILGIHIIMDQVLGLGDFNIKGNRSWLVRQLNWRLAIAL